jgi:cell division septum initiation protein DivIVA|tara:strand:- start:452 stop:775 length:324 start_codon:yes stop_codon:yes gene_type:complete
MSEENGWSEYSRLVLKELETLANNIQSLNGEIQELKQEIARMREREDRVDELRAWKDKVDEVASPSQLQVKFNEVEELKQFKTRAITIFAVVQFGMGAAIWFLNIIG